jgi:L-arabinose isomerase
VLDLATSEIWFVTGSQHLYGPETLATVARDSSEIAAALDAAPAIPARVVVKPVLTGSDGIRALVVEANASPNCVGLVTWMHTFSPAKMWIAGLRSLQRPLLHLHTQHNREIPWDGIDMDFMNLHQAAHGDREFGFIAARMRLERKVVVGHWSDPEVQERIGVWTRAACARHDWERLRIARFGENMREVAVTEGDKVEAQRRLGFSINAFGVGDLVAAVNDASAAEVDQLVATYLDEYDVVASLRPGGDRAESLRDGARIELGLRRFLSDGGFGAFTTTFEDLHGLTQLPGLAVQRLMRDGYGFGAEGDW